MAAVSSKIDSLLALDRAAVALRAASDRIVQPLTRVARVIVARKAWNAFGYARLEDLARERYRRSARWMRDLASLGESLEGAPCLAAALTGDDGDEPIGRVAALAIARAKDPEALPELISLARAVTVRELRERIRRIREAGPPASPDPDDEAECPQALVTVMAPHATKAAFDEGLLLHRAVSGREETVSSFVDALIAESYAGLRPPDAVTLALNPGESLSLTEGSMARATRNWSALASTNTSPGTAGEDGLSRAGATLEDLEEVSARAGIGNAVELDEQMRALLDLEDRIDRELGRLLAHMSARGAWAQLLFSGPGHYAEERLRLARSTAEGRTQLARALRAHPALRRAYERGDVGLEAAMIVLRILGRHEVEEDVELAWVERAKEATVRRLRDEARALGLRAIPTRGESLCPLPQSDAEWYGSLRRKPGDFRQRVDRLGRIAAAAPVAEGILRLRLPRETARGFLTAIESARRAMEAKVEGVPRHEPTPDADEPASLLAARTFSMRGRRVPPWVGLLALIEDYVQTWDASDSRKADPTYVREGWRCAAPGCTSRQNLEEHHVVYRSRGGGNESSNLVCACRFHHQMGEHRGLASCRGRAPLGIKWTLGSRGIGGRYRNDRRVMVARNEKSPC